MANNREQLLRRLRSAPDVAITGGVILLAVVLGLLGAPALLRAPVAVLAAGLIAVRVARRTRRGLDIAVVAVGSVLLALIALGFAIDALPGGLNRASWSVTAGLLALGLLAWDVRSPTGEPWPRPSLRAVGRASGRYVVAVAFALAALAISVRATDVAERAPLALSIVAASGSEVAVTVSAGQSGGSYELVLDGGAGRRSVDGPFDISPGRDTSRTVRLPAAARVTVSLVVTATQSTVRTLVLLTSPTTPTTTPTTTTTTPTTTTTTPTTPTTTPTSPTKTPTPTGSTPRPPVLGSASPLPTISLTVP